MPNNNDLYQAFKDKSIEKFIEALEVYEADPNFYPDDENKTLFELILETPDSASYIEKCIEYGADLYVKNENFKFPIHYLIKSECIKNLKAVESLLEFEPSNDDYRSKASPYVNVKELRDQNCLHLLAEKLKNENVEKILEMMFLLLSYGCNINSPNDEQETPFFIIARELPNLQNAQEILDKFLQSADIDFYTHRGDEIANMVKDYIKDLPAKENFTVHYDEMRKLLELGDINKFETKFVLFEPEKNCQTYRNNCYSYMEIAVQKSYINVVDLLIKKGINFNKTSVENTNAIPPPFQAYINANVGILSLFLGTKERTRKVRVKSYNYKKSTLKNLKQLNYDEIMPYCYNKICEKTLLHQFFSKVKGNNSDTIKMDRNQRKCFDLLISNKICNRDYLNALDNSGKTVVYYSVKYGLDYMTLKLLQKGAYIKPIVTNVRKSLLNELFDSCITSNEKFHDDKDFTITINYGFLMPSNVPGENDKKADDKKDTNKTSPEIVTLDIVKVSFSDDVERSSNDNLDDTEKNLNDKAPEMDALKLLAENYDYKSLAVHPVLSSFVFLKWKKIRFSLHINLLITLFYIFTFIPFIMITQHVENELVFKIFFGLSFTGLILLTFREILQFSQSKKKYFLDYSNWIDLVIIVCSVFVLFPIQLPAHVYRMIHTTIIMLETWEYFNLLGYLPLLSISLHTKMFRNVCTTFLKSLAIYLVMIVGFALAFHTLHGDKALKMNESVQANVTDDLNSFASLRGSVVKTFVMMTGELDASNLHMKGYTYIGLFTLFLFLVTIVLNNLLNALAVSDTQEIRSDAKLVDLCQRILVMHHHEENIFRGTSYLSSLLQDIISLFPDTVKDGIIKLKPYSGLDTYSIDDELILIDWLPRIICYFGKNMTMDDEILKDINTLLVKKREEHKENFERSFKEKRSEKMAKDMIKLNERISQLNDALNERIKTQ